MNSRIWRTIVKAGDDLLMSQETNQLCHNSTSCLSYFCFSLVSTNLLPSLHSMMSRFHGDDCINFLWIVIQNNIQDYVRQVNGSTLLRIVPSLMDSLSFVSCAHWTVWEELHNSCHHWKERPIWTK